MSEFLNCVFEMEFELLRGLGGFECLYFLFCVECLFIRIWNIENLRMRKFLICAETC
jgi:hypothetical protein